MIYHLFQTLTIPNTCLQGCKTCCLNLNTLLSTHSPIMEEYHGFGDGQNSLPTYQTSPPATIRMPGDSKESSPMKIGDDNNFDSTHKVNELKGNISFKNVWFAYKEEDYVLKNISFL